MLNDKERKNFLELAHIAMNLSDDEKKGYNFEFKVTILINKDIQ